MAMNNTHIKKEFPGVKTAVVQGAVLPTKDVKARNYGGMNDGQLAGRAKEKFANPMNDGVNAAIGGLSKTYDDITDGYHDKGETPYGEAAKFNFLPPGMDISNQENAEIHAMPLRILVAESYPGDGWMPTPRDVEE
jgi:hypothetical protein